MAVQLIVQLNFKVFKILDNIINQTYIFLEQNIGDIKCQTIKLHKHFLMKPKEV